MEIWKYENTEIWKYGNTEILKYGNMEKNPHMEENEMFMQCLMMGVSVVKGKGVWNKRKNEKIWKNCFEEIGGIL